MTKLVNPVPSEAKPLIRLSKSCIGPAEKAAVCGVLDREFLGMGSDVAEFEKQLSQFFGRPTVCVVNGTAALHLAVQCLGIGSEDEVLVPSLTYLASFQAISATGATPVACDIDPTLLTLDPIDVEKKITSKTKAIMPVHYAGGAGHLDAVYSIASRHNLRVIEDAAHAFGGLHEGKRIGSFGDVACFSFDGIKNITAGEGGCIVSSDKALLDRISDARLLGIEKDAEKRFRGERSWEFDVTEQGWRYHMSNIMASIGIVQLNRFEEFSSKRRAFAKLYDEIFSSHPRIHSLPLDFDQVVPHIYSIKIEKLADRKALQAKLLEKNIQTGIHYFPNHLLSLYANSTSSSCPTTEDVYPTLLTLPLHPDLNTDQVLYVAEQLILALESL